MTLHSELFGDESIFMTSMYNDIVMAIKPSDDFTSWDSIRKTTNISDNELTERYRNTALYITLSTILREEMEIPYVTPDEALMTPSLAEIASRRSGMSEEQAEAIGRDYDFERDKLGDYDLNDVHHRVRELAMEDSTWQEST